MLTPSVGYLILLIFGVLFTGVTAVIHRMDSKRKGKKMTANNLTLPEEV